MYCNAPVYVLMRELYIVRENPPRIFELVVIKVSHRKHVPILWDLYSFV